MKNAGIRHRLEHHQIAIYFASVAAAVVAGALGTAEHRLDTAISPALAIMLFLTFLQVPLAESGRSMLNVRFLGALLVGNFLLVPVLVMALFPLVPNDPLIQWGVLLVLLTPCIDYVITFSHMGNANTRLLMAATPTLLLVQMALLPIYLGFFLGESASELALLQPLLQAFLLLIALPLSLATVLQWCSKQWPAAARLSSRLSVLPVPATALVLFIVIASVVPQIGAATETALRLIPIYTAYAICAPLVGWLVARTFKLDPKAGRGVAFSCGTRNSLVVLPLALAVPGAIPLLPAVIVTQTMVELIASLFYIRAIPCLGRKNETAAGPNNNSEPAP